MKIKSVILILSSAFLTACGVDIPVQLIIAPQFQEYVSSFEELSRDQGRPVSVNNLIMEFDNGSLEGTNHIGICTRSWQKDWKGDKHELPPRVTIRESFWYEASEEGRHQLIYHELGHCILKRGHNSTQEVVYTDGSYQVSMPVSIMYPSYFINRIGGEAVFNRIFDHYSEELFWGKTEIPLAAYFENPDDELIAVLDPPVIYIKSAQTNPSAFSFLDHSEKVETSDHGHIQEDEEPELVEHEDGTITQTHYFSLTEGCHH